MFRVFVGRQQQYVMYVRTAISCHVNDN